jgi:hypothetical protein
MNLRLFDWVLPNSADSWVFFILHFIDQCWITDKTTCTCLIVILWKFILNYLAFKYFDFEHTLWRLFQKHVMYITFDIYVFISRHDIITEYLLSLFICCSFWGHNISFIRSFWFRNNFLKTQSVFGRWIVWLCWEIQQLVTSYPTIPVIIRFDNSVINYDLAFDNPFISETYKIICLWSYIVLI